MTVVKDEPEWNSLGRKPSGLNLNLLDITQVISADFKERSKVRLSVNYSRDSLKSNISKNINFERIV
eukprot:CAMPEP_0116960134 /NCGR_PEP_ID=MMETSP0467-20121206/45757_1 /TAXON_ID=283647 /ORGANISM="Mesodinium pulex, Strain SPMC105" /LENGTH=66 /DNA_ID=CAMNT_0004647759 /DNA_START=691 /DNA_END=891 /DNA_ORIENTATION=-